MSNLKSKKTTKISQGYYEGLASELSECRQEIRNNETLIIQILAVVGAFMAFVYGAVFNGNLNGKDELIRTGFFLLDVTIECAAYFYIVIIGIRNVFLYYFARDIEKQIATYEKDNFGDCVVRWVTLTAPIVTRNPRHIKTGYGVVYFISYTLATICAVLFSGVTIVFQYFSFEEKSGVLWNVRETVFICFLTSAVFLVILFIICSYKKRNMYFTLKEEAKADLKSTKIKDKSIKGTPIIAFFQVFIYYLYPKYKDAYKAALFILGWAVGGSIITQNSGTNFELYYDWKSLLRCLFVMDFCFYQSRYHFNDIRGVRQDLKDKKKDRIPIIILGFNSGVGITQLVMTVKIVFGILYSYKMCTKRELAIVIIFGSILLALTIFYELAKANLMPRTILLLVCLGYPYRFLVGMLWAGWSLMEFECSINIVIVCMIVSYAFYGGFAVYILWTRRAMEMRSFERTPHLKILYKQIQNRLKKVSDRNSVFRCTGTFKDLWNLTFILSIFMLSVGDVLFWKGRWKVILFELFIIVLASLLVHFNAKLKIIPYIMSMMIIGYKVIFLYNINHWSMNISNLLSLHQIIYITTYFYLMYIGEMNFKIWDIIKKIGVRIEILIIGKETYEMYMELKK